MIRRLFWTLFGLGLGLVLGVRILRQVDRFTEAAKPGAVAQRAGRRVGGTRARWRDAFAEGRDAAHQRELELRTRFGVPSLLDLAAPQGDLAAPEGDDATG